MCVVPTYNELGNLPTLVEALMQQPMLRLLVVDDQSPDGTGDLAETLARAHPGRIDVIHRTGRRGLGRSGMSTDSGGRSRSRSTSSVRWMRTSLTIRVSFRS